MPPKRPNDNPLVVGDMISPIDDDGEFGLRDALSKPVRPLRRTMQTKTAQRPIKTRYHSDYKTNNMKLCLEKLKNNQKHNVKIDLTNINIISLATQIGVLSEYVKLYMKLLTSKRYYALNDRTINLLLKGDIDMNATTSETAEVITDSDTEVVDLIDVDQDVDVL